VKCSERWIEGSATFTTVMSMMIMNWTRARTNSAFQRRGSMLAISAPSPCRNLSSRTAINWLPSSNPLSPVVPARRLRTDTHRHSFRRMEVEFRRERAPSGRCLGPSGLWPRERPRPMPSPDLGPGLRYQDPLRMADGSISRPVPSWESMTSAVAVTGGAAPWLEAAPSPLQRVYDSGAGQGLLGRMLRKSSYIRVTPPTLG